jgi:hypothetical protein
MKVTNITVGITQKEVYIQEIHPSQSDDQVIHEAMSAANETPNRLFGYHIHRTGSTAIVYLYTD